MVLLMGLLTSFLLLLVFLFAPQLLDERIVFAPILGSIAIIIIGAVLRTIKNIIFYFKHKRIMANYDKK